MTRRAYQTRESVSSSLEARQQSEDSFGAGSTRECGFREGAMVSGDTCLIVKNWTFLPASLAAMSVVSTIPSVATNSPRDVVVTRTKRVDGYRRHWGCTVPSISDERSSRLLAFSTGTPLTPRPSQLDHSYPHSPSSILHSC